MKRSRFLTTLPVAVLLGSAAAHAAEVTTSVTAPAVDGLDQANLVAPTGGQLIWSDRGVQGNTFMTGDEEGILTAITVQITVTIDGVPNPIPGWKDYVIRVGTVTLGEPNVFTEIVSETIRQEPDVTANHFFTFVLDTPVTLMPNTLYGFQVGLQGSQDGWRSGIPQPRTSGDTFAGGQRFTGERPDQGLDTAANLTGGDLVFHLEIEPTLTAPFAITAVDYDPAADTVALTWRSRAGVNYIAKYSFSMADGWGSDLGDGLGAVDDENPNDGDHITVTFNLADAQIESEEAIFFRIEEEE